MKRRAFAIFSLLLGREVHISAHGLGSKNSEKNKSLCDDLDPEFSIDKSQNGRVITRNIKGEAETALEFGVLTAGHANIVYDENSVLAFAATCIENFPIGIISNPILNQNKGTESSKKQRLANPLGTLQFGFLLWNAKNKKLELCATLDHKTEVWNPMGFPKPTTWAGTKVIAFFSPSQHFDFAILLHDVTTCQLRFWAYDTSSSRWNEIYCGNPLGEEKLSVQSQFAFFPGHLFQSTENILEITNPGSGIRILKFNFLDKDTVNFMLIGTCHHDQRIHENWEFQCPSAQMIADKYLHVGTEFPETFCEKRLATFRHKNHQDLHLYLTPKGELKTLTWEKVSQDDIQPRVVHGASFPWDVNLGLAILEGNQENSQIPLGYHSQEGFFLIQTAVNSTDHSAQFEKKYLTDINEHPFIQKNILNAQNSDSQSTKFLIFSKNFNKTSSPKKNAHKKWPENTFHLSFYENAAWENKHETFPRPTISFEIEESGRCTPMEAEPTDKTSPLKINPDGPIPSGSDDIPYNSSPSDFRVYLGIALLGLICFSAPICEYIQTWIRGRFKRFLVNFGKNQLTPSLSASQVLSKVGEKEPENQTDTAGDEGGSLFLEKLQDDYLHYGIFEETTKAALLTPFYKILHTTSYYFFTRHQNDIQECFHGIQNAFLQNSKSYFRATRALLFLNQRYHDCVTFLNDATLKEISDYLSPALLPWKPPEEQITYMDNVQRHLTEIPGYSADLFPDKESTYLRTLAYAFLSTDISLAEKIERFLTLENTTQSSISDMLQELFVSFTNPDLVTEFIDENPFLNHFKRDCLQWITHLNKQFGFDTLGMCVLPVKFRSPTVPDSIKFLFFAYSVVTVEQKKLLVIETQDARFITSPYLNKFSVPNCREYVVVVPEEFFAHPTSVKFFAGGIGKIISDTTKIPNTYSFNYDSAGIRIMNFQIKMTQQDIIRLFCL